MPKAKGNPFTHSKCSASRTEYLATSTCCGDKISLLKSSWSIKVSLEPGWGSSMFLLKMSFHFRGTRANKCKERIGHSQAASARCSETQSIFADPWKFSVTIFVQGWMRLASISPEQWQSSSVVEGRQRERPVGRSLLLPFPCTTASEPQPSVWAKWGYEEMQLALHLPRLSLSGCCNSAASSLAHAFCKP